MRVCKNVFNFIKVSLQHSMLLKLKYQFSDTTMILPRKLLNYKRGNRGVTNILNSK